MVSIVSNCVKSVKIDKRHLGQTRSSRNIEKDTDGIHTKAWKRFAIVK